MESMRTENAAEILGNVEKCRLLRSGAAANGKIFHMLEWRYVQYTLHEGERASIKKDSFRMSEIAIFEKFVEKREICL